MRYCLVIIITLNIFLVGCASTPTKSYSPPPSVLLPQYIKKIAVREFNSESNQPLLQEKIFYALKDEFVRDRRLALVQDENESDAFLTGTISRYILEPLEQDEHFVVSKYILWIWADIALVDRLSNTALWVERRMEVKVTFGTGMDDPFAPRTETEAQEVAARMLATDIVKRTIDGWFAASGVSEKK